MSPRKTVVSLIFVILLVSGLYGQVDSTFFIPPSWTEPETILQDLYCDTTYSVPMWDICEVAEGQILVVGISNSLRYFIYRVFTDDHWTELDSLPLLSSGNAFEPTAISLISDSLGKAWLFTTGLERAERLYPRSRAYRFVYSSWIDSYDIRDFYDCACLIETFIHHGDIYFAIDGCPHTFHYISRFIPPDSVFWIGQPPYYSYYTLPYHSLTTHGFCFVNDTIEFFITREPIYPGCDSGYCAIFLGRYYNGLWVPPESIFVYPYYEGIYHLDVLSRGDEISILIVRTENFPEDSLRIDSFFIFNKVPAGWEVFTGPLFECDLDIALLGGRLLADSTRGITWAFLKYWGKESYFVFDGENCSPIYYLPEEYFFCPKYICDVRGVVWLFHRARIASEIHTTITGIYDAHQVKESGCFVIYPNPFNTNFTLTYELEYPRDAELSLYDITGRERAVFNLGRQEKGEHSVVIDIRGRKLSSGVYFAYLKSNQRVIYKSKVVILK